MDPDTGDPRLASRPADVDRARRPQGGAPKRAAACDDHGRIAATHARADLDTAQLPRFSRWGCLMEAQSVWLRIGRWLRLGGSHRARSDAEAARQVLLRLAAPADAYRAT
jgi:hypothetical protein